MAGLLQLSFYGQIFVLGLSFQEIRGQGALAAGLSFLPMTAVIALAMLITPRLTAHLGQTRAIILGELAFIVGLVGALTIGARTAGWTIALVLLPIGIGGGITSHGSLRGCWTPFPATSPALPRAHSTPPANSGQR